MISGQRNPIADANFVILWEGVAADTIFDTVGASRDAIGTALWEGGGGGGSKGSPTRTFNS